MDWIGNVLHDPIVKDIAISTAAMVAGVIVFKFHQEVGRLLLYFGAQSFMNIYMSDVLSKTQITAEHKGVPASFLVTAAQQVTSFALFLVFLGASRLISRPYIPKTLNRKREWFSVLFFSLSFAMNFGLNNFSLQFLALSLNLVIRGCLPPTTMVVQWLAGKVIGKTPKAVKPLEILFMAMGVACTVLAVFADSRKADASKNLWLGVIVCILSMVSAAVNLVIANLLGTELKLNSLDTTAYLAIPGAIFLLIFALTPHPCGWYGPDHPKMSDYEVMGEVAASNRNALALVFLSGVFALAYNVLQYGIVQAMSAPYMAFAGLFNKGVTIALAMFVLDTAPLPSGCFSNWSDECTYGTMKVVATLGNILSFSLYAMVKDKSKGAHGREIEWEEEEGEQEVGRSSARLPLLE